MSWTDERIDQLKELWERGLTASQIAEKLAGGISRNAVIGKAHRLGLKARPSPVKSGEAAPAAGAAPAEVRPTPAPAPIAEAPRPKPVVARMAAAVTGSGKTSLLDLSDKICKWPIGHPGDADFHFCGKPAQPTFPYCGEHCAVAYQAQLPRRDRPGGGGRPGFPPTMPGMRPR